MRVQHWLPINHFEKIEITEAARDKQLLVSRFAIFAIRLTNNMHDRGFVAGTTELLDIHGRPLTLPDQSDEAVGLEPDSKMLLQLATTLQRREAEAGAEQHDMEINEFLRVSLRNGVFVSLNADPPYHFRHEGQAVDFI